VTALVQLLTALSMNDVTRILAAIEHGDPRAAGELLPLVYNELRKLAAQRLAQEKPGQTLQAAALGHEPYPRLVEGETAQRWDSRGHFFAAAVRVPHRAEAYAANPDDPSGALKPTSVSERSFRFGRKK
jgi:hypothetical protein